MFGNQQEHLKEMGLEISVEEFQKIRALADKAEFLVNSENLEEVSMEMLESIIERLENGQDLVDAEVGPDREYVHSYTPSIAKVRAEIRRRNS